ncbi:MAG: alpha/beta hydrolase [Magnetococcales bacterium]|nr:alpha/beta hydrolase [Magnetococcales bacterium]
MKKQHTRIAIPFPLFAILLASLLISGCLGSTNRRELAREIAENGSLRGEIIRTDLFNLLSYSRLARPDQPLTVYIEGDGQAWINRHTRSKDPTPRIPVALKLAVLDFAPNVAYLGRPCQFVQRDDRRNCRGEFWSQERFSEPVISATNQAIDQLKKRAQATSIHLVGFSGGGAVAVLAAAQRSDVKSIRTLAGNLDHQAFTQFHGVSPLTGSWNPMDVVEKIKTIPQLHFSGSSDTTVPTSIAQSFIDAQGKTGCAGLIIQKKMDHNGEWEALWPELVEQPLPNCGW